MIQRLTACILISVASWIVGLQVVTAASLLPHRQHITTQAKSIIETRVASRGKSSARQAYAQLKTAYDNEKNPYIRSSLFGIMSWIDTSYGTTKLANNQAVTTIKSWKKVFLKDGKPFVVTTIPSSLEDYNNDSNSEHAAAVDLDEEDNEEVVLDIKKPTTDSNSNAENIKEVEVEAPQKSEITRSGKDEYYSLKRWRINLTYLQSARLEWVNEVRARPDLHRNALELEPALSKTASQRAQVMRNRQDASHERTEWDGYYNYPKIDQWFADRWVRFENDNGATFTENIGYAWFDCDEDDCTDVAIASMRRVFEFFINEEGKTNDVHWKTTVHPLYNEVGVGISVDEDKNRIYMAAHYATRVIKEPVRITGS